MTLARVLQAAVRAAEVLDAARALIRAPSVTGAEGPAVEYNPANMTPPDHAFVGCVRARLRDVTGREPALFVDWAGATDARLFRALGIPTVVLGAAGSGFHGADEHVSVDSLVTLARVYLAVAADLVGRGSAPGSHSS
ncbi:MAG: M20/M25/M40 family metallo-hydrolase [Candidatus Rokuibacteriota bacterium]